MVFWFPSETEPGCYALKPRWEEYIAEFFPTLEYRQAEDLAMLMDPFANGTACVVGSKRELDYWLAEAERKAERRQRQPRTAAKGGDHTLEQETHNGTNGNG
jgi:hypothetical protein